MNADIIRNPRPTIKIRDAAHEKGELQMGGNDFATEMDNISKQFEFLKASYYATLQPDGQPKAGREIESRNLALQLESLTMASHFQKSRTAHVRELRNGDQQARIDALQTERDNQTRQGIWVRPDERR